MDGQFLRHDVVEALCNFNRSKSGDVPVGVRAEHVVVSFLSPEYKNQVPSRTLHDIRHVTDGVCVGRNRRALLVGEWRDFEHSASRDPASDAGSRFYGV
jgi:hypothetical protein